MAQLGTDFEREAVARAHASFLSGDDPSPAVRREIVRSWQRSRRAVEPEIPHAPILDDAPNVWRDTPEAAAFATIEDQLTLLATDGNFVGAVTDRHGTIVWLTGGAAMRRRAERVGFLPGGRWDERGTGTNALALALRDRTPSTVRATEHFASIVQEWVCYAAPIIDPLTGAARGVIDISTTWRRATPLALAAVTALARNLEHSLHSLVTSGTPSLVLTTLGAASASLDGRPLLLPPRQVEILTILALHPGGLSLAALHDALHGDAPASETTTKVELSRLRRALPAHIANRPYRLTGGWTADHTKILPSIADGRLDDALDQYHGPLLPRSGAPAVEEQRNVLEVAMRNAVLAEPTNARLAALRQAMPEDAYLAEIAAALEGFVGSRCRHPDPLSR